MTRETLDEAIDRMASSMTAMPRDEATLARLETRLASGSPRVPWRLAAPAAAALVTLLVAFTFVREPQSPSPTPARDGGSIARDHVRDQVLLPGRAPAEAVQPIARAHTSQPADRRGRRAERAIEQPVPPIPALLEPESLSVEQLTFDPLMVAPVEIHTLSLSSLEVPAIDAASDLEEQR